MKRMGHARVDTMMPATNTPEPFSASWRIDPEERWIEQIISGHVTLPALFAFVASIHADPSYHPDIPGLTDFRQASLSFTFDDMMQVVATESSGESWNRTYWAYVVPPNDTAMYGTLRMYQNLVAHTRAPVGLFRDIEEARTWMRTKRGEA